VSDPFASAIRQVGEQAEKIARLEELLTSTRAQTENFLQEKERLKTDLAELEKRCEQVAANAEQTVVQLAGCSVAAHGGTGVVAAHKGDYGWSPAYEDVRRLYEMYDRTRKVMEAFVGAARGAVDYHEGGPPNNYTGDFGDISDATVQQLRWWAEQMSEALALREKTGWPDDPLREST
jgi:hypothetical protein